MDAEFKIKFPYQHMMAYLAEGNEITKNLNAVIDSIEKRGGVKNQSTTDPTTRVIHPEATHLTTHQEFALMWLFTQSDEMLSDLSMERILDLMYRVLIGIPDIDLPGVDAESGRTCHSIVKKLVEVSGIDINSCGIDFDICKNRCCVFVGGLKDALVCPICKHPRYRLCHERACKSHRVRVDQDETQRIWNKIFLQHFTQDDHTKKKEKKKTKGEKKRSAEKSIQKTVSSSLRFRQHFHKCDIRT